MKRLRAPASAWRHECVGEASPRRMLGQLCSQLAVPAQLVGQCTNHAHRRIGTEFGRSVSILAIWEQRAKPRPETAANFVRTREAFHFPDHVAVEMLEPPRAIVEPFRLGHEQFAFSPAAETCVKIEMNDF